jgi:hypothetical protein
MPNGGGGGGFTYPDSYRIKIKGLLDSNFIGLSKIIPNQELLHSLLELL